MGWRSTALGSCDFPGLRSASEHTIGPHRRAALWIAYDPSRAARRAAQANEQTVTDLGRIEREPWSRMSRTAKSLAEIEYRAKPAEVRHPPFKDYPRTFDTARVTALAVELSAGTGVY